MKNIAFQLSFVALALGVSSFGPALPQEGKARQEQLKILSYVTYVEPVHDVDGATLEAFLVAKKRHIDAYKGRNKLGQSKVAFFDYGPYYGITFHPKIPAGSKGGLGQANGLEILYMVDKKTMKVVFAVGGG